MILYESHHNPLLVDATHVRFSGIGTTTRDEIFALLKRQETQRNFCASLRGHARQNLEALIIYFLIRVMSQAVDRSTHTTYS